MEINENNYVLRAIALVYVKLLFLLVMEFNITVSLASSIKKKDVIIIFVDDLRHLANKNINLTNIKNLAENGIYFENTFAQQSLCAPSRNSILTGRRPDAIHLYDFYSYWRDTVANFTTLPQFFKENGYDTYSLGKVFHPGASSNFTDDYPYSWSYEAFHPPTEKYKDAPVCTNPRTKIKQRNLICPVNVKRQPGKSLPDLQTLKYARKILRTRNSTKPFVMAVGFHKPHIPLKYPKKYLDRVPMDKIKMPSCPYMPTGMPLVSWHPWTDVRHRDDIKNLNISFPMGIMPPKWTMKIRRSYYAAVTYVDDLIGLLVDSINRSNTIIVLTSDHGWSLGENGLWAKYSNFDAALRVPLIFNIPGITPKTINSPVELIDIFPTLVDLVGFPATIPKCLDQLDKTALCFEGKSLVPLMDNQSNKEKNMATFAISQYPRPSVYPRADSDKPRLKDIKIMGYSIRTKRYRYTEWISFNHTSFTRNWNISFGSELYDHSTDTEESNNLHNHPKYKHIKSYLSMLLRSNVDHN